MMIIRNYVIVKQLKVRFYYIENLSLLSIDLERPEFVPKIGGRCMKINPDGLSLAIGDRNGNIRILNMEIFQQITLIEAHDSEVLSVDYSHSSSMGLFI